jgi:hypothetical protein
MSAVASGGSEDLILGVATILQQASSALAQLGVASQPQTSGDSNAVPSLASAASALSQLAAQFDTSAAGGPGNARDIATGADDYGHKGEYYSEALQDEEEPKISVNEFVQTHGLESWVGEMLDLLTPGQRAAVMNPPMNLGNARNLNGIVISRIKQAVPLEQRLGIFVHINALGEGVVDRISTLTPEQGESIMESGIKIQKASNPSGVAMRRITDVLRSSRQGGPPQTSSSWQQSSNSSWRHGGGQSGGGGNARERSRTPHSHSAAHHSAGHHSGGAQSGMGQATGDMPEDIHQFVSSFGLEWWCGEVLKRLSLWQRQQIMKEFQNLHGVRNPSGVVISRVRQFVEIGELMSIFIDLNQLDTTAQEQLMALNSEQQSLVITPGIYLQNVRNPSTAVRSRINNVLAGNDAFGKPLVSAC